jgi:hypothetical protein
MEIFVHLKHPVPVIRRNACKPVRRITMTVRLITCLLLLLGSMSLPGTAAYGQAMASPEALASRQLAGYNARNIEMFLEAYSDSVRVYDFPQVLRYEGKDKMRETYAAMFSRTPDLHCELVNRLVSGNTVIDHERVTFSKSRPPVEVFAMYKIRNNKIAEVYFIPVADK